MSFDIKCLDCGHAAFYSPISANCFPRVAIVDDAPEARQLIRRILQAQGNYTRRLPSRSSSPPPKN